MVEYLNHPLQLYIHLVKNFTGYVFLFSVLTFFMILYVHDQNVCCKYYKFDLCLYFLIIHMCIFLEIHYHMFQSQEYLVYQITKIHLILCNQTLSYHNIMEILHLHKIIFIFLSIFNYNQVIKLSLNFNDDILLKNQ